METLQHTPTEQLPSNTNNLRTTRELADRLQRLIEAIDAHEITPEEADVVVDVLAKKETGDALEVTVTKRGEVIVPADLGPEN